MASLHVREIRLAPAHFPMRRRLVWVAAGVILALLIAVVAGCAGRGTAVESPGEDEVGVRQAERSLAAGLPGARRGEPLGPDPVPPGAMLEPGPSGAGANGRVDPEMVVDPAAATRRLVESWLQGRSGETRTGIALHRVLVREDSFQKVLAAPYRDIGPGVDPATPIDAFERARDHGLVLVRLSVADLLATLGKVVIEPLTDSGWLGVVSTWQPLVEAARIDTAHRVRIGDDIRIFDHGRFRLLARAFPVRTMDDGLVLRVELLPHLHQPRIDPMLPDWEAARYAGEIVPEAAIAVHLRADEILVICGPLQTGGGVPAAPGESSPIGNADDQTSSDAAGPGRRVDSNGGWIEPMAVAGPEADRVQSIGEVLLRLPFRGDRAILVIVPHGLTPSD